MGRSLLPGEGTLRVVAQLAVGFDNISRADANRYRIPFTNTADVLTEATAEFALFALGDLARKLWTSEKMLVKNDGAIGTRFYRFWAMKLPVRQLELSVLGESAWP